MDSVTNPAGKWSGPQTGYLEVRAAVIADASVSYWLRASMAALEKRDPLDALKDAELLALLAQLRAQEILGQAQ